MCVFNAGPPTLRRFAGEPQVSASRVKSVNVRKGREAGTRSLLMHFTPTYSSWLNQVENWFSRIQRDVISRGIFTSVKDLDRKLTRYIRQHNENPAPIKWKYNDPSRRIRPVPFN
ncbi:transposase [Cupriavidus sp. 8B]